MIFTLLVLCSTVKDNIEKGILELTNKYRRERILEPLKYLPYFKSVAQEHAERMCKNKSLTHESSKGTLRERLSNKGFKGLKVAENIAKQQASDYSEVVRLWISSEPHRKYIVGDFDYTGVGTCKDDEGYRYYIQIFGKEKNSNKNKETENDFEFKNIENDKNTESSDELVIFVKKPKNKSAYDSTRNPFSYKIMKNDGLCSTIDECEPGSMVKIVNRSGDDGYREPSTSSSKSIPTIKNQTKYDSENEYEKGFETVTKTNIIYKTVTRGVEKLNNTSNNNKIEPEFTENTKDSITFTKYLSSIKDEIIKEIKKRGEDLNSTVYKDLKDAIVENNNCNGKCSKIISPSVIKTTTVIITKVEDYSTLGNKNEDYITLSKSTNYEDYSTVSQTSKYNIPYSTMCSEVGVNNSSKNSTIKYVDCFSDDYNSIKPFVTISTFKKSKEPEYLSSKYSYQTKSVSSVLKNKEDISDVEVIKVIKDILKGREVGVKIVSLDSKKIKKDFIDIGAPFKD